MDLDKFQDSFTWIIEQIDGNIIRRKDNADLSSIHYIKYFYLLFKDRVISKIKIRDEEPFFYWEVTGKITDHLDKERVVLYFGSKIKDEELFLLKIDSNEFKEIIWQTL